MVLPTPGRPGYLGVVGRDAPIETINWFEGEPCFFFHVFNARSDGDKVVCDVTRNRRPSVFPDPDGTMPPPSADMPLLVRWTPDLGAGTDVVPSEILAERPGEFPRYDERFNGRPYRHAFSISSTRENGKVWSRRCGPLSQSKMWRLGRIVGACCPESGGAPSF